MRSSSLESQHRREKLDDFDPLELDEKISLAIKKALVLEAPAACAEAIRNAVMMDLETALTAERKIFERLKSGEQSKALRYLFFAERAAGKVKGIENSKARPIQTVGILGAGTMGGRRCYGLCRFRVAGDDFRNRFSVRERDQIKDLSWPLF